MAVELSATLLAGILAAQVAQLGVEARFLQRLSKLEERVAYVRQRVDREHG